MDREMQFRVDALGLSGSVTTILRDLIHQRLGLFYAESRFDQVGERLAPLVVAKGLDSFMDYYYLLRYSTDADEWLNVMDALAVHETYFWREIDQLRAVVTCLVPQLVAALGGMPLRIWSVPCATGEEPLTMAMLLSEAGWFERAPIELLGSDASPSAIARAKAGRYRARAFRNLPEALREKYFTAHADDWTVTPHLHRRITYSVVNVMAQEQMSGCSPASVMFCRNLFIYFSDQSIRQALRHIEDAMRSPGYLCVGSAESLLRRTTRLELEEIGGAFIYSKQGAVAVRPAHTLTA